MALVGPHVLLVVWVQWLPQKHLEGARRVGQPWDPHGGQQEAGEGTGGSTPSLQPQTLLWTTREPGEGVGVS